MKESLILVRLDTEYCNYLRKFDDKVPYNYNEKELRPFVGVLFEVNNCKYFAPLSSPKPKHLKLKLKIDNGTLDSNIAKRCCDFKLLEEKCNEYNNVAV